MKYNETEQIPDGMMERISARLEEHANRRKKSRKLKYIIVAALVAMVLPLSVFSVTRINWDWGWRQGIEIAVERGKTVVLDKTFEYKNHKIKFENAVWEDYALIISYSIPDFSEDQTYIPAEASIAYESGAPIRGKSTGREYYGKGKGSLRFGLENLKLEGQKIILRILTLQNSKVKDAEYKYQLKIDNQLLTQGKADLDYEFDTPNGTVKFTAAKFESNELILDYSFEPVPEAKELLQLARKGYASVHGLFPEIYLKDNQNNVVKSQGMSSNTGEIITGQIYFPGTLKNLDYPLQLAFECKETIVSWELPIQIEEPHQELIKANKSFKVDGGTLSINNMSLGAASTYLEYDFKPSPEYKEETAIRVRPTISMTTDGIKYSGTPDMDNRAGKIIFKYPLEREMLKRTIFKISSITRTIGYSQSIPVDESSINNVFDLEGAQLKITNMEIKDGHTNIDIEVNQGKRKYYDFNFNIIAEGVHSFSSTGKHVYADKDLENKILENPSLFKQSHATNNTIKKSIEIDGEFKKVEIEINELIYIDICNKEFRVK